MNKLVAVIGMGRFGASVAQTLFLKDCDVIGLDENEDLIDEAQEFLTNGFIGDSTEEKVLKQAGIHDVDLAVVAIGTDLQSSILTVLNLKEMGVTNIIAKATTSKHGKALEKIGATTVVYPERDMGKTVAQSILTPHILDTFVLEDGYSLIEVKTPQKFIGKTLSELDVRKKYKVNILAIQKDGKMKLMFDGNELISENDILIVLGKEQHLDKFTN